MPEARLRDISNQQSIGIGSAMAPSNDAAIRYSTSRWILELHPTPMESLHEAPIKRSIPGLPEASLRSPWMMKVTLADMARTCNQTVTYAT